MPKPYDIDRWIYKVACQKMIELRCREKNISKQMLINNGVPVSIAFGSGTFATISDDGIKNLAKVLELDEGIFLKIRGCIFSQVNNKTKEVVFDACTKFLSKLANTAPLSHEEEERFNEFSSFLNADSNSEKVE